LANINLRSLKVISLLSMQKTLAKDIFTLKKDGAKRHQLRLRRINFQSSIFNSGLSGLGLAAEFYTLDRFTFGRQQYLKRMIAAPIDDAAKKESL
jgi:hypothetical protein